jgi:protein-L-isoaspartate(D-aspartate) O-methyltransferase
MLYDLQRKDMVDELKKRNIIISLKVYNAMLKVPRHVFMPEDYWHRAYLDTPQPIDKGQTISAPHMNAMMCEYLDLKHGLKILEIGTGSGYQAALLASIIGEDGRVYTVERIPELSQKAQKVFDQLGYKNIISIIGDGSIGYEKFAPYDRILVTAAAPEIPKPLLMQLNPNDGIMCIPVGERNWDQDLLVIHRNNDKFTKQNYGKVVFVPLLGEKGFKE